MCCGICPEYDDCEKLERLKNYCCEECPDYEECIGGAREDFYDFKYDFKEDYDSEEEDF